RRDARALPLGAALVVLDDESLPPARHHRRADRLGRNAVPERLLRTVVRLAARVRGPRLRAALLVTADRERRAPPRSRALHHPQPRSRRNVRDRARLEVDEYRKTMGMTTKGPSLSRMLL